jgi:hypothetical protein
MDMVTIDRPSDRAKRTRSVTTEVKTLHLALQGGGAHGALAWGLQDICARKLLQRTDR